MRQSAARSVARGIGAQLELALQAVGHLARAPQALGAGALAAQGLEVVRSVLEHPGVRERRGPRPVQALVT